MGEKERQEIAITTVPLLYFNNNKRGRRRRELQRHAGGGDDDDDDDDCRYGRYKNWGSCGCMKGGYRKCYSYFL